MRKESRCYQLRHLRRMIMLGFMLLLSAALQAQDIIVKRNGTTQKAKVSEITSNEVHYKEWDKPDGETYAIEKDELLRIEYANGEKEVFYEEKSVVTQGFYNNASVSTKEESAREWSWEADAFLVTYSSSFNDAGKGSIGIGEHSFCWANSPFGASWGFNGLYNLQSKKWGMRSVMVGPNVSYPLSSDILLYAPLCYQYDYDAKSSHVVCIPSLGVRIGHLFISAGWCASYDFKFSKENLEAFSISLSYIN